QLQPARRLRPRHLPGAARPPAAADLRRRAGAHLHSHQQAVRPPGRDEPATPGERGPRRGPFPPRRPRHGLRRDLHEQVAAAVPRRRPRRRGALVSWVVRWLRGPPGDHLTTSPPNYLPKRLHFLPPADIVTLPPCGGGPNPRPLRFTWRRFDARSVCFSFLPPRPLAPWPAANRRSRR